MLLSPPPSPLLLLRLELLLNTLQSLLMLHCIADNGDTERIEGFVFAARHAPTLRAL
jgi:hypothetical protein